ncbi:MAG TPA: outer membrane beta-barrel protein [Vicinamibacteria bacterium]|nr:outer membrane beta-barrel protein [Vicinamibacteria bacterium]
MTTLARRRLDVARPLHRTRLAIVLAAMAGALLATSADAADLAVGAEGGYFAMTNAQNSAKAIFDGSTGGGTFGGFLHVGLGERFFVEAHGRRFQKTGDRVFVADATSPVFHLGHPLTVRTVPFYGMVGYKFLHGSRWAPYVALGIGSTQYRETSDVAGLVETSSTSKASGLIALGVDFLTGPVRLGAEVSYSTVPNAIGDSGVSKVYGENNVGGISIVGRLSFGTSAP